MTPWYLIQVKSLIALQHLNPKLICEFASHTPFSMTSDPEDILIQLGIQHTLCASVLFGDFCARVCFFEGDSKAMLLKDETKLGLYSILSDVFHSCNMFLLI